MRCLVTGAAGFIGSNLTDHLLAQGHRVTGVDNLSTGRWEFLDNARQSPAFTFIQADLLNTGVLTESLHGVDICFHLAANADVRFGTQHPRRDLEQNTIVTSNVLEAVRLAGVKRIVASYLPRPVPFMERQLYFLLPKPRPFRFRHRCMERPSSLPRG
jgi:UDP-glucose 4-epimerase